MPQFDFFIWFSLSLGTILTFQLLYYFLLYYIIAPFSNLQKTLIKLYNLKQSQKELLQTSLFEHLTKLYFQRIKLKKDIQDTLQASTDIKEKKSSKSEVKAKTNFIKKKISIVYRKKNAKKLTLKKKDILIKNLEKKLNIISSSTFLIYKKVVQKKAQKKNLNKIKSTNKKSKKS